MFRICRKGAARIGFALSVVALLVAAHAPTTATGGFRVFLPNAPSSYEAPWGTSLPVRSYQTQTFNVGQLRVVVRQEPTYAWPLETPKLHLQVTNTAAASVLFAPSAMMKETGLPVVAFPQVPRGMLAAGATAQVSAILDRSFGLDQLPDYAPTVRTLTWTFEGQGTLDTALTIVNKTSVKSNAQAAAIHSDDRMTVSGRVVDDKGNPLLAALQVSAGDGGYAVASDSTGRFSVTLPKSTEWVLTASKTGYRTSYTFLDEARDYPAVAVTLLPRSGPTFTYGTPEARQNDNAFWKGAVSGAEDLVLLTPGMEIWNSGMGASQPAQKLALYTTAGQRRWEYPVGWDAWGADLTTDGRWAAYVTLPVGSSTANPVGTAPGVVGVLDAGSGQPVWSKQTSAANFPGANRAPYQDCRELRFSPNGQYLAMGCGFGDLYLLDRTDGSTRWATTLGGRISPSGQVRAIRFSPDGQHLFAAAGDGGLRKIAVADGTVLWTADVDTWAPTDAMAVSPDGATVGAMSKNGQVTAVDGQSGAIRFTYDTQAIGQWVGFTPDSQVLVASSFQGTYGFVATSGDRVFRMSSTKAGRFLRGPNLWAGAASTAALFDQWGTRLSNLVQLPADGHSPQFVWASADGTTLMVADALQDNPGSPVLFTVGGTRAGG